MLVPGIQSKSTAVTASTLPAHEPFGAQPGDHSLGVGALPGNQSESGVARLPNERAETVCVVDEDAEKQQKIDEVVRQDGGIGGPAFEPSSKSPDASAAAGVASGGIIGGRDDEGRQQVHAVTAQDKQEKQAQSAPESRPRDEKEPSERPTTQGEEVMKDMEHPAGGSGGHKGKPNQVSRLLFAFCAH